MVNYLVSRCPDAREVIEWTEARGRDDQEITPLDIQGCVTRGGAQYGVIDFLPWGFLQTNLKGQAWDLLDSIQGQRGLETWRRVVKDVIWKGPGERFLSEREVTRPDTSKTHADVPRALQDFELKKQKWYAWGGRRLGAEEEASIVRNILPLALREKVIYDHDDAFLNNPEKLN